MIGIHFGFKIHFQVSLPVKSMKITNQSPPLLHTAARTIHVHINSLRQSDAYICVDNLISIGSDNGLAPGRRQAIIRASAGIVLIGPIGSEVLMTIHTFSFMKMHLKMSPGKWRPFFSTSMY